MIKISWKYQSPTQLKTENSIEIFRSYSFSFNVVNRKPIGCVVDIIRIWDGEWHERKSVFIIKHFPLKDENGEALERFIESVDVPSRQIKTHFHSSARYLPAEHFCVINFVSRQHPRKHKSKWIIILPITVRWVDFIFFSPFIPVVGVWGWFRGDVNNGWRRKKEMINYLKAGKDFNWPLVILVRIIPVTSFVKR